MVGSLVVQTPRGYLRPLTPLSLPLQNFAPQMSYGYDEKAGGMAVPGPMVSARGHGTRGGMARMGGVNQARGWEHVPCQRC